MILGQTLIGGSDLLLVISQCNTRHDKTNAFGPQTKCV